MDQEFEGGSTMNKFSIAILAVASGLIVANTILPDISEPEQIDTKSQDQELRKAWLVGTCAENITKNCELVWDRRGYCVCLTKDQGVLQSETKKEDVAESSKWKFLVCRKLESIVVLIQDLDDLEPIGYTCSTLSPLVTSNNSVPSYSSSLEAVLESQCGWPVTGSSWACCPRCIVWDVGCPPCPDVCKYGEKWPKFTEECKAGL